MDKFFTPSCVTPCYNYGTALGAIIVTKYYVVHQILCTYINIFFYYLNYNWCFFRLFGTNDPSGKFKKRYRNDSTAVEKMMINHQINCTEIGSNLVKINQVPYHIMKNCDSKIAWWVQHLLSIDEISSFIWVSPWIKNKIHWYLKLWI